jgi:hypothetical protein
LNSFYVLKENKYNCEMDNSHSEAFALLGLDMNASAEEINRKFRLMAREFHPDKPGGDDVMIRKYTEAREKAIAYTQANSGGGVCNEDWERRWKAQWEELKQMKQENRQLREQNDAKDAVVRGVELKLEQTVAELDQKAKQLVRSERERVRLEEKVQTLQASLDGEEQRAEIAEDRAKEWEQKYNGVQQEQSRPKKCKVYNDKENFSTECAKIVRSFVELHIEEVSNDTRAFVPTQRIYETFQRECSASIMHRITFTIFSMELANQIADQLPEACRARNNSCKGYSGIVLK